MVMASVAGERPAKIAAWRAGACPTPPWSTLPMYTSVILEAGTLDLSRAARMAVAPRWGAETLLREPLNYDTW